MRIAQPKTEEEARQCVKDNEHKFPPAFKVESVTKAEKQEKKKMNILGNGVAFRNKEASTITGNQSIDDGDIPFN
jgi:hypothetical protein